MPEAVPDRQTTTPGAEPRRGHPRTRVEMLAHFRRDLTSTTVVLKDLTPDGARVEGVGALCVDEVVTLALPACRPCLAFVVWANAHCAGLQFLEPLAPALFADIVAKYGLGDEEGAPPLRIV
ncbi:hypothetical protein [Novosphingobium soli]|uniref:PilZ domain-containing protein n=1 Tax=Novosphingobium soli TaxID=574956 RepID=A0ABV6CWM0_9SPHN